MCTFCGFRKSDVCCCLPFDEPGRLELALQCISLAAAAAAACIALAPLVCEVAFGTRLPTEFMTPFSVRLSGTWCMWCEELGPTMACETPPPPLVPAAGFICCWPCIALAFSWFDPARADALAWLLPITLGVMLQQLPAMWWFAAGWARWVVCWRLFVQLEP